MCPKPWTEVFGVGLELLGVIVVHEDPNHGPGKKKQKSKNHRSARSRRTLTNKLDVLAFTVKAQELGSDKHEDYFTIWKTSGS